MLHGNDDDNGDEDTDNDGLDTFNDDNDGGTDPTGKGLARPRLPGIVLALLKAASFARW